MRKQSAPDATAPQCMHALERANKIRIARAELKRHVMVGKVHAANVILNCPEEAETMAIGDLLISQLRWGRTRCRRFLREVTIRENKPIGTLTDRQRRVVADLLRDQTPAPLRVLPGGQSTGQAPAPPTSDLPAAA
jgi:hypothetical protein